MRFNRMDSLYPDQLDFVPRERRNGVFRFIAAFSIAIVLVFILAYAPPLNHYALYSPLVAILLMAILCLYVVYHQQIILDLVLSTEYQNLLFTQALHIGSTFFMIVRRDGTIVHASEGMSEIIPGFDYAQSQALDGLFTLATVRKTDRERIMGAIYSNTREQLVFPLISQYQPPKEYIMTVEPMVRPAGFSVLRGREYHGQRGNVQRLPDSLSATSVERLEHLLSTTDAAHYTTDAFGRFEYVNPAFERMLGYDGGEIVASKLSLHHVVFSLGAIALTEEYHVGDYMGLATIQTKQGTRDAVAMRQTAIRNGQGKTLGATGTLVPQLAA